MFRRIQNTKCASSRRSQSKMFPVCVSLSGLMFLECFNITAIDIRVELIQILYM